MRIYRCLTARQITNLFNKRFSDLPPVKGGNTHKYEKDKDYIHFFKFSGSAEYLKNKHFMGNQIDQYIMYMIANVPEDILNKYFGYGIYRVDNEIIDNEFIPLPEYAIPRDEFDNSFIVEINNCIRSEFQDKENIYDEYLRLINNMMNKYYHNCYKVAEVLGSDKLNSLLGIKVDDRTEDEIFDDDIKQLCKIMGGLYE